MRRYKELLTLYKHPYELIRLGRRCDGGYVVPKELLCENLLTCGISDEVTFEEDYLKMINSANIHAFDGTIKDIPVSIKCDKVAFHKKNIGSIDNESEITLNKIIEEYFVNADKIFLKMDIEGGEYPGFETITRDNLLKFNCIVIEVHSLDQNYDSFESLMERIESEFILIHKHDNNCGKYFNYNGNIVPNVYELTFVRKDLISSIEPSDQKIHIDGLDYPNSPLRNVIPDV